MIHIIHKTLVLIKNNLNYLKDIIFEYFFNEYNRAFQKNKLFITYNNGKIKS